MHARSWWHRDRRDRDRSGRQRLRRREEDVPTPSRRAARSLKIAGHQHQGPGRARPGRHHPDRHRGPRQQLEPVHVDGNNADRTKFGRPILPAALPTTTPRAYRPRTPTTSLELTRPTPDPTTVNFKLNPKAVWGDGSPVDADDWTATWKACNGENNKFQCASTQGFDQIADITTGADKFDVTVTFKGAYPDWTQPWCPARPRPRASRTRDVQHRLEGPEQRLVVRALQGGELRQQPEGAHRGPQRQVVGRQAAAGQDHVPGHLDGRDRRPPSPTTSSTPSTSVRIPTPTQRVKAVAGGAIRQAAGTELPALHLQHQRRAC